MKDLHLLPKVRDSWSHLYVEHVKIDQEAKAIALWDKEGKTLVPCATLTLLMLGPGTKVTHAAIKTLADHGTLVAWVGEESVRYYASGAGETRSSANLLRQAAAWADMERRMEVVRRLYRMRFPEPLPDGLTLQQLRGREGARVRDAYAAASRASGVPWQGRSYKRDSWGASDPVNRALSAANSCLYGVVQAAIISAGYSPAIGFIHTGKMLSFVYDVADLYKVEVTVPAAFEAALDGMEGIERRTRMACRDTFRRTRLLKRIVDDLADLFDGLPTDDPFADDEAAPGGLWDPVSGVVAGGENYGEEEDVADDSPDVGAGDTLDEG